MKNCGHMFREKLPFSEMWEELHKVAILKRKVGAPLRPCCTSSLACSRGHAAEHSVHQVPSSSGRLLLWLDRRPGIQK